MFYGILIVYLVPYDLINVYFFFYVWVYGSCTERLNYLHKHIMPQSLTIGSDYLYDTIPFTLLHQFISV